MAFINECISEEDKQRINFDKLTEIVPPRPRPVEWTIDRETGNFLIIVCWPSAGDRKAEKYIFSWNGYPIYFSGDRTAGIKAGGEGEGEVRWYGFRTRATPRIPEEIKHEREVIYEDFKKALLAHKANLHSNFQIHLI